MSESEELKIAQSFIASGEKGKALPILSRLRASKNLSIKLDANLALLVTLDHLTQNEELLKVTKEATEIAIVLKRTDVHAYLLSQNAQFLFTKLSQLTYQQGNLNLASRVFRWVDFSLEVDKKEFEELKKQRQLLKKEIAGLELGALTAVSQSRNHYMNGHIFLSLGEISFARFLENQLDLYRGGKLRSKIINFHFIRRWGLDKLIGYSRIERRKLRESLDKGEYYMKIAIEEFHVGGFKADLSHALYSLAGKFALTFRFRNAKKYLKQARRLAESIEEKNLFIPIAELEKMIKDRYRHTRNYVEEQGLDLPRALRN
jgi:hypothetical protein